VTTPIGEFGDYAAWTFFGSSRKWQASLTRALLRSLAEDVVFDYVISFPDTATG
jgi:hypothetical protein